MNRGAPRLGAALTLMLIACTTTAPRPFAIDYDTPVDAELQQRVEEIARGCARSTA